MSTGVPAGELSDDDLARELATAHEHRHDTFLHGTDAALETHTRRTAELEREHLRRFPERGGADAAPAD